MRTSACVGGVAAWFATFDASPHPSTRFHAPLGVEPSERAIAWSSGPPPELSGDALIVHAETHPSCEPTLRVLARSPRPPYQIAVAVTHAVPQCEATGIQRLEFPLGAVLPEGCYQTLFLIGDGEPPTAFDLDRLGCPGRPAPPPRATNPDPAYPWGAPYRMVDEPHLDGSTFVARVRYTGGCAEHRFTLRARPALRGRMELLRVDLVHDANDDRCDSTITREVRVALPPTDDPPDAFELHVPERLSDGSTFDRSVVLRPGAEDLATPTRDQPR